MWSMFALVIFGLSEGAVMPDDQAPNAKPQLVHGFLDAHWEYPNFLPDDLPHHKALPFEIREKKWLDLYAAPDEEALKYRPSETRCFRIAGEGFIAPRKPTSMWPADEQFIFTKIVKMEMMQTDAECEKRIEPTGR